MRTIEWDYSLVTTRCRTCKDGLVQQPSTYWPGDHQYGRCDACIDKLTDSHDD